MLADLSPWRDVETKGRTKEQLKKGTGHVRICNDLEINVRQRSIFILYYPGSPGCGETLPPSPNSLAMGDSLILGDRKKWWMYTTCKPDAQTCEGARKLPARVRKEAWPPLLSRMVWGVKHCIGQKDLL